MLWLYSILLAAGLAALSPVLWLRDRRSGRYTRRGGERLGRLPRLDGEGAIWVHAVSVGEALAVERLIGELGRQFPGRPLVLSVTTAAAREVAERRMAVARIFYFPLDFRFSTRRALRAVRPALVLIAETEIWPRFLREARKAGARVVFVNGRISGRSFARYRWVRPLLRGTLARVDGWLMQTETDAERARDLGADPRRVEVTGNLKFDLQPPESRALLRQLTGHFRGAGVQSVIVAGSTMEGEEEILLAAFGQLRQNFPAALLILAPRHPRRFEPVAKLLAASGLPWSRRSQIESDGIRAGGVWLLDSLGELAPLYRVADAAFVGGSLAPHGGHNLLEPAYFAAPVVFGPAMHNFAAIAEEFLAARAAFRVESGAELENILRRLLSDDRLRISAGQAARALLEAKTGATARVLAYVAPLLAAPPSGAMVAAAPPQP
ncbi:MAG: 3-deoxy-D-manno-octulosonic acid transferase [Terriglobales bacterium]